MGFVPVVLAVVVTALLGTGLWMVLRRAIHSSQMTSASATDSSIADEQHAAPVYRGEAWASLTAFLVGAVVTALMWSAGSWWPQGYGLPYALAGAVGAIAGLTTYNLYPRTAWKSPGDGPAVAELTPRGATSFARHWVFILPLSAALTLILGLVLTGLYSVTDENGLHRLYQRRGLSGWGVDNGQVVDVQYNLSTSGPFPGWYYGVPMMIGAVLLIAVVYWSLRRIAATARPASSELFDTDTRLRSMRTMFVMSASSATLAIQVAGLLAITGNVLRFSHTDPVPTADTFATPDRIAVEPGHTLALIAILVALVIAVAAVVLLVKAFSTIAALWSAGTTTGLIQHEPVR